MRSRMIAFISGSILFWILPKIPADSVWPQLWQILLLLVSFLLIIFLNRWLKIFRTKKKRQFFTFFPGSPNQILEQRGVWVILLFITGLTYPDIQFQQQSHLQQELINIRSPVILQGKIIQSNQHPKFMQMRVRLITVKGLDFSSTHPVYLKLNWYQPAHEPKIGETWEFKVKLKPIHGYANPGGFDYERWAWSQHLIAKANVYQQQGKQLKHSQISFFLQSLLNMRNKLNRSIENYDGNHRGLFKRLLTGDRVASDNSDVQILKRSGLSHLLAISGLHIGMIFMFAFIFAKWVWTKSQYLTLWIPAQTFAKIMGLLFAFIYLGLSGAGLPAIRAFTMLFVYNIGKWINSQWPLFDILLFTLVMFIVIDPATLLEQSVWLSFGAVFIIILALSERRKITTKKRIRSWIELNVKIWIGMIPIGLGMFSAFYGTGVIANLIAIPLMTFLIMPALFMGSLVALFMVKAAFPFWSFADFNLNILVQIASWLSDGLYQYSIHLSTLYFFSILVLLLLIPVIPGLKSVIIVIFLFLVIDTSFYNSDNTDLNLWVFDVGQGQTIYVEYKDNRHRVKNLMIDTAARYDDFYSGQFSWYPYLVSHNIKTIDDVVISHSDNDHSGGFKLLSDHFILKHVFSSYKMLTPEWTLCHANQTIFQSQHDPELKISVISPDDTLYLYDRMATNNLSCVIEIRYYNHIILIPGDSEKLIEKRLLAQGILQHTDVLIAPHHGSQTSSSKQYVKALSPEFVIFSTGFMNRFKFPRKTILDLYREQGANTLNTATDGAIRCEWLRDQVFNGCKNVRQNYWGKWHWTNKQF